MRIEPADNLCHKPVDFHEAIRQAVVFVVTVLRSAGTPEREIRAKAVRGLKEAIEGNEGIAAFTVETAVGPVVVCASSDLFRLVFDDFGVDRSDPFVQESAFAYAVRYIDEVLADPAAGSMTSG